MTLAGLVPGQTGQIQPNPLLSCLLRNKQLEPHDPFSLPGQSLLVFQAHLRGCLLQEALLDRPSSSQGFGLFVSFSLTSTAVCLPPWYALQLQARSSDVSLIIIELPTPVSDLL